MFANAKVYSGFAVDDLDAAREFYADTLGVKTSVEHGLMTQHLAGDRPTLVYPKPGHTPATYTILNFPVTISTRPSPAVSAAAKDPTSRGSGTRPATSSPCSSRSRGASVPLGAPPTRATPGVHWPT